ncbi:MAG: hypothetical protein KF838_09990 [Phycisphaeraceae bacterium]|nr:MAG: hypothetical protein KF838_09990 [Phycisphaeraceae bacterium]
MALTTLYLDLNSYFASVEQQERPDLRSRPIGVVAVLTDTTSLLAASVEAKRLGIKTGTSVRDARRICPSMIFVESRPRLYVEYHHRIIEAIERCIPIRGVHSIDEVSCRLQPSERNEPAARELALSIKQSIRERIGNVVRCSIGIAPNRFLGKVASDMMKPDGLVIIDTHELPQRLFSLELIDLPGIGRRMRERLDRKGIRTIEELCTLSEREMEAAWESIIGRTWWHWVRGHDVPEPPTRRRSIGHQHVLPPKDRTDDRARAILVRLLNKAGSRLRHIGYGAAKLSVWLRYMDPDRAYRPSADRERASGDGFRPTHRTMPTLDQNARSAGPLGASLSGPRRRNAWANDISLPPGSADTLTLLEAFARVWETRPRDGRTPLCVGVTLHELAPQADIAAALFQGEQRRMALAKAVDRLDAKYGRHTVYPASMHDARTSGKGGIAFQSVPDLAIPDTLNEPDDADDESE